MNIYQMYYMRRHVPPEGSIHIVAEPVGTVQAISRKDALAAAQQQFPQLKRHMAVEIVNVRVQPIPQTKSFAYRNRSAGGSRA